MTPQISSQRATECRSCAAPLGKPFLSLGNQPLVNRPLSTEQLHQAEPLFPTDVVLCEGCGLVQLTEAVDPEVLFSPTYPYQAVN